MGDNPIRHHMSVFMSLLPLFMLSVFGAEADRRESSLSSARKRAADGNR